MRAGMHEMHALQDTFIFKISSFDISLPTAIIKIVEPPKEVTAMKQFALILALALLLSGCVKIPPPADTAPPQTPTPPVISDPAETTQAQETTIPVTTPIISDFSQYEALLDISANPNWLARSLGCLYEHPWKLDLYYLFYLGVGHPGSWNDISEESRRKLVNEGFLEEFDLQIMPVEKLEAALQDTFGVSLSSVDIPEDWCYIEAEDAYCSNHSDAYFPGVPVITSVEDDGTHITIHYTMEGYWIPGSDAFLDKADLILSLIRNDDGTIHAVSNLLPVN